MHVHRVDTSTTSRGAMISIPTFTSTPQDTRHAALLLSAHAKHAHHPSIHTHTRAHAHAHTHINIIIITHPATITSRHSAPAHVSKGVCVCVCALRFMTQDTLTYTRPCWGVVVCVSARWPSVRGTQLMVAVCSAIPRAHTSVRPSRMQQQPSHSS